MPRTTDHRPVSHSPVADVSAKAARTARHTAPTRPVTTRHGTSHGGLSGVLRALAGLLLLLVATAAPAATRAWLDRDHIGPGETVTLNIETDGRDAPDYGPLRRDFSLAGMTSRSRFELSNGRARMRTLHAVALRPRRGGRLQVPALTVGTARTQPLTLQVDGDAAPPPPQAGGDVFIESAADDRDPYVQQAVGWVVRLYSAVPIVSGQLDQPTPDGASLQRIGTDAQYTRQIGSRRYNVVERRFLLTPERSGVLQVPPAVFEGQGTAGFFDELLGRDGRLRARAAAQALRVRGVPANAPQPWLPLHRLQLRYRTVPQALRSGTAAALVIEATADGATAAQMPELELPAVDGLQVFAEPAQADERFVDGRPQVTVTRRFSLVPERGGALRMPGLRLPWWNVDAGRAAVATVPALGWTVTGPAADPGTRGATAPAPVPAPAGRGAGGGVAVATAHGARPWILATLGFAALWLLTLVWAVQRGRRDASDRGGHSRDASAGGPGPVSSGHRAALRRALDTGDLGDVGDALVQAASPPARDLDEVAARLDDPAQRDAVRALQRARWGGGDGTAARAALRSAFAAGPRWRPHAGHPPSPLPPLYPPPGATD